VVLLVLGLCRGAQAVLVEPVEMAAPAVRTPPGRVAALVERAAPVAMVGQPGQPVLRAQLAVPVASQAPEALVVPVGLVFQAYSAARLGQMAAMLNRAQYRCRPHRLLLSMDFY